MNKRFIATDNDNIVDQFTEISDNERQPLIEPYKHVM